MTATRNDNGTTRQASLHVAFELGWTEWKVAFTTGQEQKARVRTISAQDLQGVEQEISQGQAPLRPGCRRPGAELLRGRPRWLLVAPVLDLGRRAEFDRGFLKYRGEPPQAPRKTINSMPANCSACCCVIWAGRKRSGAWCVPATGTTKMTASGTATGGGIERRAPPDTPIASRGCGQPRA